MVDDGFRVFNADDSEERSMWLQLWDRSVEREPFGHPAYSELFTSSDSRAVCAVAADDAGGTVIHPFLVRDIAGESPKVDVSSPYGYGGPIAITPNTAAATDLLWSGMATWARTEGVVSEFVRFPLDAEPGNYPGQVVSRSLNYVRSIEPDLDQIWREVDAKVRKNVNRAARDGVTVSVHDDDSDLGEFIRIYEETMARRSAAAGYFFGRSFFEQLCSTLGGSWRIVSARHKGRVVSTELVLLSSTKVYSFLGGTDQAAFDVRPNDALKWEIVKWASANGYSSFVLGGGAQPGDGIERYKRSLAPNGEVRFFTGQRIFDGPIYDALVVAALGPEHDTGFFPAYRAGTG